MGCCMLQACQFVEQMAAQLLSSSISCYSAFTHRCLGASIILCCPFVSCCKPQLMMQQTVAVGGGVKHHRWTFHACLIMSGSALQCIAMHSHASGYQRCSSHIHWLLQWLQLCLWGSAVNCAALQHAAATLTPWRCCKPPSYAMIQMS